MSLPNIPDITPEINITREDVITLLLASVAMEEMGLAHILNAEGEKIQYALRHKDSGQLSVDELKEINKNVQQMVDAIARLEMLLQMKVENILSFTSTQSRTTSTRTTSTCTQTTCTRTRTSTTTSCTCTHSFTTACRRRSCPCTITGDAEGDLLNAAGTQVQGTAAVACRVTFPSCGNNANFLRYSAQPVDGCGRDAFEVTAMPRTLGVEYICPLQQRPTEEQPNQFIIKGQGIYSDANIPASVSQIVVHFTLWVIDCGSFQRFRIKFYSDTYNLAYDSRFVNVPAGSFSVCCPGR